MADDADEANYDHLRTYEPPALMVAPEAESRIGGGRLLVALILAFALWALIWAGVATWL